MELRCMAENRLEMPEVWKISRSDKPAIGLLENYVIVVFSFY